MKTLDNAQTSFSILGITLASFLVCLSFLGLLYMGSDIFPNAHAQGTCTTLPGIGSIPDVDGDGTCDVNASTTYVVTIPNANQSPVANISGVPSSVLVGTQINPSGSNSFDQDGPQDGSEITDYSWQFGDGATGSGENVTHTYTSTGLYTVTLTVTDDDNDTASTTLSVDVQDPSIGLTPSTQSIWTIGGTEDQVRSTEAVVNIDLAGVSLNQVNLSYQSDNIPTNLIDDNNWENNPEDQLTFSVSDSSGLEPGTYNITVTAEATIPVGVATTTVSDTAQVQVRAQDVAEF